MALLTVESKFEASMERKQIRETACFHKAFRLAGFFGAICNIKRSAHSHQILMLGRLQTGSYILNVSFCKQPCRFIFTRINELNAQNF